MEPSFPFGNFKDVVFARKSMGVAISDIYKEFKSKGVQYGGYYAFNQPVFTTTSPELIKNIIVKDFNNFDERGEWWFVKYGIVVNFFVFRCSL